jgi:hypothetical protein
MQDEQNQGGEAPLKVHGDKLNIAARNPAPAQAPSEAEPAEGSLKEHGDKLQSTLDKATR